MSVLPVSGLNFRDFGDGEEFDLITKVTATTDTVESSPLPIHVAG
jgi:hypothetical protein